MATTTLKGPIKGAYLPDIFQAICASGVPGIFHFVNGPHKVMVYIGRGGLIIHAISTNRAVGLEALEELAVWSDGTYSVEECPTDDAPVSITKSTPTILGALATKIDEWKVLNRVIPSIYLFPYPAMLPGEKVEFNSREARLFEYANGYYTVEELAQAMGQPIAAIAKTMYGLITKDRLVLKAVRYSHPPAVAQKPVRAKKAHTEESGAFEAPSTFDASGIFNQIATPPAFQTPEPEPKIEAPAKEIGEKSSGSVMDYVLFAQRIWEEARKSLPEALHGDVDSLFNQYKATFMFDDGGADIKTLKSFAVAISKHANLKMAEKLCDKHHVIAYNQEVQRLFGK
jgi:hypothetical protein